MYEIILGEINDMREEEKVKAELAAKIR